MTEIAKDDSLEQESLIGENGSRGFCSKLMKSKSARLSSMLALVGIYFLAEVIVGHITYSLTLVADSFHMLSDGLSLIVGLIAVRMSKRKADKSIKTWPSKQQYFNTFGWVRFEVVGALINATFLLALCISILLEAIVKFYEPQVVSQPILVLAVGGGGLLINIFGLLMFGSHAHGSHDHGSHSDNHTAHNHNHASNNAVDTRTDLPKAKSNGSCQKIVAQEEGEVMKKNKSGNGHQMNMKAVFLHVLGDALGSVIVMISALVVYFVPHNVSLKDEFCGVNTTSNNTSDTHNHWIVYLDPTMSVLLVLIMVSTTVPLFKKSSLILLQTVPKNINVDKIKEKLEKIDGVQEIHEFHVWQLAGDKYVATVHVQCKDSDTYLRLAEDMKERLHKEDIHSLTIQPEFKNSPTKHCSMRCPSDLCKTKVCCEIPKQKKKSPSSSPTTSKGGISDRLTMEEESDNRVKFSVSGNSIAIIPQASPDQEPSTEQV